MNFAGYEFEFVGDIEPVREADGSVRQLMPQGRYKNSRNLPLNRYGAGPFCKFTITNRRPMNGVYVFSINGTARYVGECAKLSARFNAGYGNISPKNCFRGGQETNCRLNNLVYLAAAAGERISLWFFKTDDYKATEAVMRSKMKPVWNRM
jgi:hypothetical protein